MVARAARETDNGVYPQPLGEQHGIFEILVKGFGYRGVGVYRVSVAGQRADLNIVFFEGIYELFEGRLVGQQFGRVAVLLSGVSAGADFNRADA